MNKSFLMLGLSASLLAATPGWSGTMGVIPVWKSVSTLSLGPVWGNAGTSETFFLTPEIEKSYVSYGNSRTNTLFDAELFWGAQRDYTTVQAQFGFAVAATTDAKMSGIIWDDADPLFDNYSYRYKVQHTHLALKGKLLFDQGYYWGLIPWIDGSIGVGFNTAHGFVDTPLIEEAVVNPYFRQHTQTAFTYTVGAGVQKYLTDTWQVGVGYEFADWGKSRLNRAPGQTLNTGLGMNHYYTNGLMFNITYLV